MMSRYQSQEIATSRNGNLRMPKGPLPSYHEDPHCRVDGFGETRSRHHDYHYEQQQQQQQHLREERRERRDFDGRDGYRQPFANLENEDHAQRPAHNQRPVQTRAFTERGRYEHQLPNENQPLPRRPIQTRGFTESPKTQYQPFSKPENREYESSVQPPYQHQSANQVSLEYQPFPKSPVRDKLLPSTEHHYSSQGKSLYQPFTPSEGYNLMRLPGRDRKPTQQPPQQGHYEPPPPPFQESQPLQPDPSALSQFNVQRKPLRAYKSSPAVNIWAQQDGIVSQDTQKAWDIQAERLLRNNTSSIPPIPQQSWNLQEKHSPLQSASNNGTKNAPPAFERPGLSLKTSVPPRVMDSQLHLSPLTAGGLSSTSNSSFNMVSPETRPSTASSSLRNFGESKTSLTTTNTTITSTEIETTEAKTKEGNAVKNAFREVRHFAGGLIHHPSTSTKHFSILRHSHGLVFYQGPSTSLAITIFASEAMPPQRKIYLQAKGWTGKTGMRAAAFFGATTSWIDVTPSLSISSSQLNPRDERAWQRDIKSFKKRSSAKIRERHVLRETDVIRIPAEAGDGYFQLVMTVDEKKKVICSSPTFRLLSVSSSPSSLKGASLGTLPMELGFMALGVYAKKTAGTVLAPALAVGKSKVITKVTESKAMSKVTAAQKKVEKVTKHVPSGFMQMAANAVEGASGAHDKEKGESGAYILLAGEDLSLTNGPSPPYPIHFSAKSKSSYSLPSDQSSLNASSSSLSDHPLSSSNPSLAESIDPIPHITISSLPDLISQKLYGHYFGWTRYKPNPKSDVILDDDWHNSIISALPPTASQLKRANFRDAGVKRFTVKFIDEVETDLPVGEAMEIYIMGFLAPDDMERRARLNYGFAPSSLPSSSPSFSASQVGQSMTEEEEMQEINNLCMVQAILANPAWSPEAAKECGRAEKVQGLKKVLSGVEGVKGVVQGQMGRVDVSRLGVRMEGDVGRDAALVVNGFVVRR